MILCFYQNCSGGFNSWIFDPSSPIGITLQWVKTLKIHENKCQALEREGQFLQIQEREF